MELLPVIFQMVVALVECLFKFDEFLTLLRDLVVVAEAEIELLILNTLALLLQQ